MAKEKQYLLPYYKSIMRHVFRRALEGQHDYVRDIAFLEKCLSDVKDQDLGVNIEADIFNVMGAVAGIAGKYEQAQMYFQSAYSTALVGDNIKQAATSLVNFGISKLTEGQLKCAEEVFLQTIDIMVQNNMLPLAESLSQLAIVYYRLQKYEEVYTYYNKFQDKQIEYRTSELMWLYKLSICRFNNLLVRIAIRTKKIEEAFHYLAIAKQYCSDNQYLMLASLHMVDIYISNFISNDKFALDKKVELATDTALRSNSPSRIARFFLDEASELYEFGLNEVAIQFALLAKHNFVDLNMKQDLIFAEHLIQQINTP